MAENNLQKQALDYFKNSVLAVIATTSEKNEPEAATVIYLVDDDLNFYFVSRRHTRKVENLLANKNIAIVVGSEMSPITVQANGKAELMEKDIPEFLKKLSEKKNVEQLYYGPFLSVPGLDFVIFKVKLTWLRALCLNKETKKEEYFQIIPW